MSKFTIEDFKGVIPALITCFDENQELDEKATRDFLRYLLGFKIGGLYVAGSTGETFLMTSDERKRVLEIVMDEVGDKIPVVAHIGAMSTKASIDLAKHAQSLGVAAISSVPPFYWKFTEESIVGFYKDIAGAVEIPMIVYNIPLAGMMTVDTVKKLSKIKNVKGIKYTGTALYELSEIKDATPDGFKLYGGADELASSNLALGVDGIIGSFYNMLPDLFISIDQSVKAGDINSANKKQENAVRLILNVLKHGSMTGAIKSILRKAGVNAGYARKPFFNFTGEEQDEIVKSFLEVAKKYNINDIDIIERLRK